MSNYFIPSTEEYQCLDDKCKHKFKGPSGPITCPKCNGIMLKWLNYGKSKETQEAEKPTLNLSLNNN